MPLLVLLGFMMTILFVFPQTSEPELEIRTEKIFELGDEEELPFLMKYKIIR